MNVLMMTNTYLPQVGGVARSVASTADALRRLGHRVLVVAPTYEDMPAGEEDVLRVPAVPNFNGSEFSLRLPVPVALSPVIEEFRPGVVHAHHPFLLGDTALRVAALHGVPLVFTHHTMYEQYTHYLSVDSDAVRRFAVSLPTEFANLCDAVVAPSESVAGLLRERGVTTPVTVVPTGIDPGRIAGGDGAAARERLGVPAGVPVVGHVGRLAPEKNLPFLARAAAAFLRSAPDAQALVVGGGPADDDIRAAFGGELAGRLHLAGTLGGRELADAYAAMDVFAFASVSETQGMVLAEAMTAGMPVVALDAPGARDVVEDGVNGRLLPADADEAAFAAALAGVLAGRRELAPGVRATAETFSLDHCAGRLRGLYERLGGADRPARGEDGPWAQTLRLLDAEWHIWGARFGAAYQALAAAE